MLARIIEPTSKLDSARVLEETGISAPSYRTLLRRLPAYAKQAWRQKLAATCAAQARLGRGSLNGRDDTRRHPSMSPGMGSRRN